MRWFAIFAASTLLTPFVALGTIRLFWAAAGLPWEPAPLAVGVIYLVSSAVGFIAAFALREVRAERAATP